jgi:tripartite-type tricarboxylate transporter receptor subunit TctC
LTNLSQDAISLANSAANASGEGEDVASAPSLANAACTSAAFRSCTITRQRRRDTGARHPSIPAKSLKELLALARSRAGEITYATAGLGGGQQIATELLSQMARVSFLHVPHQGVAPAMSSVLGGHVAMIMLNVPDVVPYAASGKLRPIAVTSAKRSPALTDTPTIAESGFPGYDFQLVIGAVTMRAAPRDAVNRLSAEIVRALEQPQVRESFGKLGFVPAPLNPEQFDAFIRAELQQNEKVARQANIRID